MRRLIPYPGCRDVRLSIAHSPLRPVFMAACCVTPTRRIRPTDRVVTATAIPAALRHRPRV